MNNPIKFTKEQLQKAINHASFRQGSAGFHVMSKDAHFLEEAENKFVFGFLLAYLKQFFI